MVAADSQSVMANAKRSEEYELMSDSVLPSAPSQALSPRPPPPPRSAPSPRSQNKEIRSQAKVIYSGNLSLRVRQLRETIDAAAAAAKAKGGFVESMSARTVTLRVPAAKFSQLFKELLTFGEVLSRSIQAFNVTNQFTDLEARLGIFRDTRERLLKILETLTQPAQRLRMLQEIKRLTDQIESLSASLQTLKSHLSFSTIHITFTPFFEGRPIEHRSPFLWVRRLQGISRSFQSDHDEFKLTYPEGFVAFSEEDSLKLVAADNTRLRGAVRDNLPRGSSAFWAKAITFEMIGRGESLVAQGETEAGLCWRLFRSPGLRPSFYLTGTITFEKRLLLIEVYFPNERALETHRQKVEAALKTTRFAGADP